MTQFTDKDIARRVIYRSRNDTTQLGTIRDVVNGYVDVAIDGSTRARFYIPFDMVTLVPDDLE
jgi:hypothetical protein